MWLWFSSTLCYSDRFQPTTQLPPLSISGGISGDVHFSGGKGPKSTGLCKLLEQSEILKNGGDRQLQLPGMALSSALSPLLVWQFECRVVTSLCFASPYKQGNGL